MDKTHPQLNFTAIIQMQIIEILLRLEVLSLNGNMETNQERRGVDEMTHGPTLMIQNPKPSLEVKNL